MRTVDTGAANPQTPLHGSFGRVSLRYGSGTSLIAAEMTGRICCGLEISPAYVDVILRRWQTFTGRTAIHHASGQSLGERADRQDPGQSGSGNG